MKLSNEFDGKFVRVIFNDGSHYEDRVLYQPAKDESEEDLLVIGKSLISNASNIRSIEILDESEE